MRHNYMRKQKDNHGGRVSISSCHWCVPGAGQMVDHKAAVLQKSSTIQVFLGVLVILVVALFVVLSDRASAARLDLSSPPWPQMNNDNLQSFSESAEDRLRPQAKEDDLMTQLISSTKEEHNLQKSAKNVGVLTQDVHKQELGDHRRATKNSKYSLPHGVTEGISLGVELVKEHPLMSSYAPGRSSTLDAHGKQVQPESADLVQQHPSSNAPGPSELVVDANLGVDAVKQQDSVSNAPLVIAAPGNDDHRPEEVHLQIADVRMEWIQFPYLAVNETEHLMLQIRQNGTLPCHNIKTQTAQVLGLPQPNKQLEENESTIPIIRLYAGLVHELMIISIGDDGRPRCAGGDYYEADLSGPKWKSRPPVLDCNNGTYSVRLQMDPRFAFGMYTFKIILLFNNFHALQYHPRMWARMEEVATYQIEFVSLPEPMLISILPQAGLRSDPSMIAESGSDSLTKAPLVELPMCKLEDFNKKYWSGRWTRENDTEDCEYDRYGRWKCVDTNLKCQRPWCEGRVGSLESNGWVYSAHCAFKIFEKEEAWQCLNGKWLFFWGDSNHIDTIRNLLNFVLGFEHRFKFLDRRMDVTYFSPPDNRSSVRITSMFNGHSNVTKNYEGLFSLHDPQFSEQLRSFFMGETGPDIMIMNSGLHDGVYWKDVERFMKDGVEFAADFWSDVWGNMKARRPDLLYRTTITTGGNARNRSFNPHKMELFNHLMVDRFLKMELDRFHIIDGFDYTYPWHYDHKTNDGVHYGRPPSKSKWAGGNMGHRYFVDLMLVHMLLNAICPLS